VEYSAVYMVAIGDRLLNNAATSINRVSSSVYGGDDGARTRDLRRDRAAL
jgi:hypothetical protein